MDVGEFLEMVMPGIGERCHVNGCAEWQDHFCLDGTGRCTDHCTCNE